MECNCRNIIPKWGGRHARWGPTEVLPNQPKKLRVSNPDRFPMCMLATVSPPPRARAILSCLESHCRVVDGGRLGVPLSDLRLLCGSIDGWGGESWYVHPNSIRQNVKTFNQISGSSYQINKKGQHQMPDKQIRLGRGTMTPLFHVFMCRIWVNVLRLSPPAIDRPTEEPQV